MTVTDYVCECCDRFCEVMEEVTVDREPYGDQFVERRTCEYFSMCCFAGVEFLEREETVH